MGLREFSGVPPSTLLRRLSRRLSVLEPEPGHVGCDLRGAARKPMRLGISEPVGRPYEPEYWPKADIHSE
jgi:hypothetical protein